MIKFPSIMRTDAADLWSAGEPVYVHPQDVVAIEGFLHQPHARMDPQKCSRIFLTGGAVIEVMRNADTVQAVIDEALNITVVRDER